jgi:hypothetical protein
LHCQLNVFFDCTAFGAQLQRPVRLATTWGQYRLKKVEACEGDEPLPAGEAKVVRAEGRQNKITSHCPDATLSGQK